MSEYLKEIKDRAMAVENPEHSVVYYLENATEDEVIYKRHIDD